MSIDTDVEDDPTGPALSIGSCTPDVWLSRHAAAHHGVFRRTHAFMAGLTERQAEARVGDGRWIQLHRNVYRICGAPRTWHGDVLAACWAGGFQAVASFHSAAALHGLPGGHRDIVEITCPRWRRARHDRLIVHETLALEPIDLTVVAGIAVTTAARTLFDLSGVWRSRRIELALENILRRGLASVADIAATVERTSRSGRPGGPILRELLAARAPDRRPTESEMETLLLQAVRAHGLPEPTPQYKVWHGSRCVGRVDAAYPEARIAIEYDSDEFHSGRVATNHDRARRHELIAASWLPIDVGPADLRKGGTLACAAIASTP